VRRLRSLIGSRVGVRFAALIVGSAALVGVLGGFSLHLIVAGSAARSTGPDPGLRGQAVWPPNARPAPDFSLSDQDGRRTTLASFRGRSVVLTFMESRCHQECPLQGRALAAGFRKLPPDERPVLVAVSVDPWADTARSARDAIGRWGLDSAGSWHWLLGSRAQLARVWNQYRVEVRRTSGDITHTDATYLIDRRGFERAGFVYPFLPGWISSDLAAVAPHD
jgi:protein SCO1/2